MVRFPTERTTVIVLANTERVDPSSKAFEIGDRTLAHAIDHAAPHANDTFDGSAERNASSRVHSANFPILERMGTAAPTIRRGGLRRAIDTRPGWVAAAIGVLTIGTMIVIAVGIGGPMKDLEVYLLAGRAFGRGADIYADGFGHVLATPLPYTYPPSWAAALSLVAWLPRGWLGLGWTLLNVALLLWVTRVSYRAFLDGQGAVWPVALACVAGIMAFSAPVLSVFDLGQVGILLLAMVLADTIPAAHAAATRRAGRRGDRHQAHAGCLRRVLDRHEALARRGDGDRERDRYLGR